MGAEVGLAGPPTVNMFALEYRIGVFQSRGRWCIIDVYFFSDALTYGRGLANPAGSQD